jgi:hypothetical protein
VLVATGEAHVVDRALIDREEPHRRAIFRRHVGDRRAIGEREARETGAVEFDELADDLLRAQHLRNRQHEVGRRRSRRELAEELEADDLGNQHRQRLPEHCRLRLDAPDAPSEDAEPIDHRGVGIGADQRVRIGALGAVDFVGEHDTRQILQIHLVDDAGIGGDHAEVLKGLLSPPEKLIPLLVAIELLLGIDQKRRVGAIFIDLNRVIDHQIDRLERVDTFRGAAEPDDGIAHRGEIDDRRHAGKVLQQHATGAEGDFLLGLAPDVPSSERFNVRSLDERVVLVAQEILEQDAQRDRQALDGRIRHLGERAQS